MFSEIVRKRLRNYSAFLCSRDAFCHYRNFCDGMGNQHIYLILKGNKTFGGYGRYLRTYHPSIWQARLHKWDFLEEEVSGLLRIFVFFQILYIF